MICWCAMVIVLAATALAETCTELRESCNTQSDYKWSSQSQDDLRNLPWPATNEDYAPYRVWADEFCRKQNATAHCKKDLIARCPDDPYLLARALSYGPYSIEWSLSMLALCQSDINLLRYLRAERHCRQLTREVEFQLHRDSDQEANQRNVTDVKSGVCRQLRDYVERLEGPLNVTLSSICGSDAVEVMRDGYRARHAAFCSV